MKILVTGSIAFDYLMRFPGKFTDHILPDKLETLSLSFLVESMTKQRGGTAPNIAYTLSLFGTRTSLLATAGEDFAEYRQWLDSCGVDTSLVKIIPGEFTASFFVNTDQSNSQIASFYPGAMTHAAELSLRDLEGDLPDLVIISPNDPRAMCRYVQECIELDIPYIYDPSQQIVWLDPDDLAMGVSGALGMCVNEYEYSLIQAKLAQPLDSLIADTDTRFTVVTRGHSGALIYDKEGSHSIPAVSPTEVVDPTGVGDAFRGGFLTGLMQGLDLGLSGRIGALAATYCIESRGPQGHSYTIPEFVDRFRRCFDDAGQLEVLLDSSHVQ